MTLESLYYITQIIAVLMILISLAFLALQGRQTQKQIEQANLIAEAELSKSGTDTFVELIRHYYVDEDAASFMDKCIHTMEPLNDIEQEIFLVRMDSIFASAMASNELYQKGLMSEDVWARGTGFATYLLSWPRTQKWWATYRELATVDDNFKALIDNALKEISQKPNVKLRDIFDLNTPLPPQKPIT